jgi:hypothetical protein
MRDKPTIIEDIIIAMISIIIAVALMWLVFKTAGGQLPPLPQVP